MQHLHVKLKFLKPRVVPFPTLLGWLCLLCLCSALCLTWWYRGEAFLSHTERIPARVLVVEGWISVEGVRAAKEEYRQHGYEYVVTTGGLTGHNWDSRRWSYAAEAQKLLLRWGIPPDRVILAKPKSSEAQRTFESVIAVRDALREKGVNADAINVFTRGAHARRSRLTFAKVFGPETKVGVIAWLPPGYDNEPWWHSSDRTDDLLKETLGYWFELLLNAGRMSNRG